MSIPALLIPLLLCVAALGGRQSLSPQPSPEHKRLQFFVGDWKVEGDIKQSAFGPAGKMTATQHCEWFDGQFHVTCRGEGTELGVKSKDLVIFGYDAAQGVYTRYNIGSSGEGALATAKLDGKIWRWQGGEKDTTKGMQVRFPATEVSPDSYTFQVDVSIDGKPFVTVLQGKATRIK